MPLYEVVERILKIIGYDVDHLEYIMEVYNILNKEMSVEELNMWKEKVA